MNDLIDFELPSSKGNIIKVIGVGGGGSNAVNHMYRQGIKDVDFAICNTDVQHLLKSPVPVKVQLGSTLTEGRGAGNKPVIGRESANENIEEVEALFSGNTKMVFITAGMGGGTGTGAAPVIAEVARTNKILTIGIVTIPFRNEGKLRIKQAIDGILQMENHVDSLLIINNERIREIYGDFAISKAFSKADDVLATAARGIADIITSTGFINVDFEDVRTVMQNSGVAIMGSATCSGPDRALKAAEGALNSPLLNNNDIRGSRNILVNITSGEQKEVTMDEVNQVNEFVQEKAGNKADLIHGIALDSSLGEALTVTIVATGFKSSSIPEMRADQSEEKVKVRIGEEMAEQMPHLGKADTFFQGETKTVIDPWEEDPQEEMISSLYPKRVIDPFGGAPESVKRVMHVDFFEQSEEYINELSKIPAYERKRMKQQRNNPANDEGKSLSRFSISGNPE
ncbi:MAG: cell division protein FtsZ, partial [Marinilabiliales bacterium]|nr:cell division protein FtsZ [Marinilabiliales bacterium]